MSIEVYEEVTSHEPIQKRLGLTMDNLRDLRVHPEGRHISFTSGPEMSELWVMRNFLPEPEATE